MRGLRTNALGPPRGFLHFCRLPLADASAVSRVATITVAFWFWSSQTGVSPHFFCGPAKTLSFFVGRALHLLIRPAELRVISVASPRFVMRQKPLPPFCCAKRVFETHSRRRQRSRTLSSEGARQEQTLGARAPPPPPPPPPTPPPPPFFFAFSKHEVGKRTAATWTAEGCDLTHGEGNLPQYATPRRKK